MSWINLLNAVYPIGSIYCSTLSTSPAELLGGSWTKIEEAVLRSSDDAFGYTGADSHAITIDEMPNHKHGIKFPFTTQGVGYYAVWLGAKMGDSAINDSVTSDGWVQKYGGGARDVSCPTFVQLQHVVSNCLVSLPLGEVI